MAVFAVAIAGCGGCATVIAQPDPEVIRLHKQLEGKVDVGSDFILAVKDGKVYGWGTNLPNLSTPKGESPSYDKPVIIPIPAYVVSVSAAWWHSVALDKQGRVWAWGSNRWSGLGERDTKLIWKTPRLMKGLPPIKAISADGGHTLALAEDGSVWLWGHNKSGESAKNKTLEVIAPYQMKNLPPVKAVYATPFKSFAVTTKGEVYLWGARSLLVPQGIQRGTPHKLGRVCPFIDLDSHASIIFVCGDGSVSVIGDNTMGDLGLGDNKKRVSLTVNPYLKGVLEVTGGGPRIALLQDGRVSGWGDNAYGVPEFTNTFMKLKPVRIKVGKKIIDVASTNFNAFLVSEKGQILKWEINENWLVNGLYYFFGSYHFEPLKNQDGTAFNLLDK